MKKSLIAAAIATLIAAPAANAGVILYGMIHASVDFVQADGRDIFGEPINFLDDAWYVSNRASRIGFKGTEDLGNGLSLIWKAETSYNLSESGDGWGSGRNAYIGLAGDWGTFLYGRHDTPMKISTGRLDLFSDQIGDYNNSIKNEAFNGNNLLLGPGFKDVRAGNAIAYISPNWNGLTLAGAIVPGEGEKTSDANGLADAYSVAAMYENNGLYLAAAYERFSKEMLDADNDYKQWRIGIGYTINAFTLNAVYENQQGGTDANMTDDHDLWQISGAYDFGNNRFKVAYGENKGDYHFGDMDEAFKSTNWAVGLDHKLSKRTIAYVVYASDDESNPRHVFPHDSAGREVSGLSLGMMHTF